MSRYTAQQAFAQINSEDESEPGSAASESERDISSRPRKRRGPKQAVVEQKKKPFRSVKPKETSSSSDEDEEENQENNSEPETAEQLQPVESGETSSESSESEQEESTPKQLRQRRRMKSPMQDTGEEEDEPQTDAVEFPISTVRKSLKFDELSLDGSGLLEENVIPSSSQNIASLNPAEDTLIEGEEEQPATAVTNQPVYMKPSEVLEIMRTIKDPWKARKDFLFEQYQKRFSQWHLTLRMNLNILLHGVGSKRSLLETFREHTLTLEMTAVIEGFRPNCDLKLIFGLLYAQLLDMEAPKDPTETVDGIGAFIAEHYEHFHLLVHSIDGPALRNSSSQQLLARFARHQNVHMVATLDHPNLPQLWSQKELEDFRWTYQHAPTLLDYEEYPLPDLTRSGPQNRTLILASLQHVFESLTANAKLIYQEIAKFQTQEEEVADKNTTHGMPYKDLYKICRSSFLVSTEPALRKQLTEFYDHNLLQSERGTDGVEYLRIPISKDALKEFLSAFLD